MSIKDLEGRIVYFKTSESKYVTDKYSSIFYDLFSITIMGC